ncbi:MAG: UDP-2,3-diacylglucosamine diphosphatase [Candidatus Hydrogenedentota bacterium]|nr:MAG: UDP-2,3-diacylglucosamine diphosphatase [Candidatus Hydrogenedentota bacterium]
MDHKKILFICDAHLGSGVNEQEKERVLIEFIKSLSPERVSALYMLGDVFDFWFEYESVILSPCFRVLTALSKAVESGVEVHLIVGNHDFWAGDFLKETIGLKVHYGPIEINLDGLRIYMCHGDGLNPHDRGYRIFKAIIRSKAIIWVARRIHPDCLMRIARRVSKFSREGSSVAGKLREDDGIRTFALKKLQEGFDIVIAGHSHHPHDETHSIDGATKRYYNVGDMQESFSCLEYSDGRFRLKYLGQAERSAEPENAS